MALIRMPAAVLAVVFLCTVNACFSQSAALAGKTYFGEFGQMTFDPERVTYSGVNPDNAAQFSRTYEYELIYDNHVPFLKLRGKTTEKWLVLFSNDLIFVYEALKNLPFFYGTTHVRGPESLGMFPNLRVSSYLVDNGVSFDAYLLGFRVSYGE